MKKYFITFLFILILPIYSYAGLGSLESNITGFQASDWSTDGSTLYTVKASATSCVIYKSTNRGVTFTEWASFTPAVPINTIWGKVITLFIPDRVSGETTDKMFFSWVGNNRLYYCSDISQETPTFTEVLYRYHLYQGAADGGVMSFEEDSSGNLYAGWYALNVNGYGGAEDQYGDVYKSTDRGANWTLIKSFETQHIHNIKINPYNGWLYVVCSEWWSDGQTDSNAIYRSKDNGSTWVMIYNGYIINSGTAPCFVALSFFDNILILGEDTSGLGYGNIWNLVDDGLDTDHEAYLVDNTQTSHYVEHYTIRLLSDGTYLAPENINNHTGSYTARIMTSTDGETWSSIGSASSNGETPDWALGNPTTHPDRAGRAIFSLSSATAYYYDYEIPEGAASVSLGAGYSGTASWQ